MPAGLQIFNTSGTIQIDETYQNYMLDLKSSIAAYNITSESIFGVEIITASVSDLVAVRCDSRIGLHAIYASGSGLRYVFAVEGSPGTNVIFYRFRLGIGSGSNYGLQVFNGSGQLVFDALQPSCRIHTVLNNPNYENYFGNQVYDTSKTFAIAFGAWAGTLGIDIEDTGTPGPIRYLITFWKTMPAIVNITGGFNFSIYSRYWNNIERRGTPPAPYNDDLKRFQALIIDVTNY